MCACQDSGSWWEPHRCVEESKWALGTWKSSTFKLCFFIFHYNNTTVSKSSLLSPGLFPPENSDFPMISFTLLESLTFQHVFFFPTRRNFIRVGIQWVSSWFQTHPLVFGDCQGKMAALVNRVWRYIGSCYQAFSRRRTAEMAWKQSANILGQEQALELEEQRTHVPHGRAGLSRD